MPSVTNRTSVTPHPTVSAPRTLRTGMKGEDVKTLQRQLTAAGFPVPTDGSFGPKTEAAVRGFQRAKGLPVDGAVGRGTRAALAGAEPSPSPSPAPTPDDNAPRVKTPAELRQLNNTRVDTRLPDAGYGFKAYSPQGTQYRYGTERTVEMMKTVAARYHQATGQTLRIGDMSKRGGGDIPGHGSHEGGKNVDIDMAFTDGRTTAERNRESVNASWRSPSYDRAATRKLVQEIKRANPNAQILFNDPVLVREGLVRKFPNHDNHLHLQGLN